MQLRLMMVQFLLDFVLEVVVVLEICAQKELQQLICLIMVDKQKSKKLLLFEMILLLITYLFLVELVENF
ncbi:hypothetical protein TPHV1_310019 [Treponema phagedenis]|uniref:Uncharacterized protein n=1 Tax=Treponema phagedenis TaxID=162 RepID=A0A0B7GZH0_TREPH|nr:hypothetical protein TPHV1_310019 [Treponema phagedenis]